MILLDSALVPLHQPGMDPVREKLLQLLEAKGETLKSASLAIGRNHAYLHQYVHTGKPRRLPEDIRYKLARFLDADERLLRDDEVNVKDTTTGYSFAFEVPRGLSRDLPVVGRAKAGFEGFFFDQGRVNEVVDRPSALAAVQNAFAIYAVGSSMEPRYFEGELLYVNPNKPPARGDFVVIELHDGSGFIKRLVKVTDKDVVVSQLNPHQEITFKQADVAHIYRIVGSQTP